jgi:hypothetical protein
MTLRKKMLGIISLILLVLIGTLYLTARDRAEGIQRRGYSGIFIYSSGKKPPPLGRLLASLCFMGL